MVGSAVGRTCRSGGRAEADQSAVPARLRSGDTGSMARPLQPPGHSRGRSGCGTGLSDHWRAMVPPSVGRVRKPDLSRLQQRVPILFSRLEFVQRAALLAARRRGCADLSMADRPRRASHGRNSLQRQPLPDRSAAQRCPARIGGAAARCRGRDTAGAASRAVPLGRLRALAVAVFGPALRRGARHPGGCPARAARGKADTGPGRADDGIGRRSRRRCHDPTGRLVAPALVRPLCCRCARSSRRPCCLYQRVIPKRLLGLTSASRLAILYRNADRDRYGRRATRSRDQGPSEPTWRPSPRDGFRHPNQQVIARRIGKARLRPRCAMLSRTELVVGGHGVLYGKPGGGAPARGSRSRHGGARRFHPAGQRLDL